MKFDHLIHLLRDCWDTSGGHAARRLLWSMFNQFHSLNVWDAITSLNTRARQEIATLIELDQDSRESFLKQILTEGGEMTRIDTHPLP